MDKHNALKILNPILAVLVLNQLLLGLLNDALSDEVFELFHGGGGFLLVMGVIVHLGLNWGWVRVTFFKKKSAIMSKRSGTSET
jgi:hypothetical protein